MTTTDDERELRELLDLLVTYERPSDEEAIVRMFATLRCERDEARRDCSVARQSLYEVAEQRNDALAALATAQQRLVAVRGLVDDAIDRARNALDVFKSKPSHVAIGINNTLRALGRLRATLDAPAVGGERGK